VQERSRPRDAQSARTSSIHPPASDPTSNQEVTWDFGPNRTWYFTRAIKMSKLIYIYNLYNHLNINLSTITYYNYRKVELCQLCRSYDHC
jgi:hypothetical protein